MDNTVRASLQELDERMRKLDHAITKVEVLVDMSQVPTKEQMHDLRCAFLDVRHQIGVRK